MTIIKITKNLDWFPAFANEITIESGDFTITMKSNTTVLEIDYNEEHTGYSGARGIGVIDINLDVLNELRAELDKSVEPVAATPDNDVSDMEAEQKRIQRLFWSLNS